MKYPNPTIVFSGNKKVELINTKIPEPKKNEVLIKTRLSLISTGTEISILSGDYYSGSSWDRLAKFPYLPGYCNVGEIVEVTNKNDESLIGLRVASWGTHSAYHWKSKKDFVILNNIISDEDATFITLGQIAMNAVRKSKITWGQSAAVIGMGLIGQLITQLCHIAGARPIFAVNRSSERLHYVPKLPAIISINSSRESTKKIILDNNDQQLIDYIFEASGDGNSIPEHFNFLRKQGTMVIAGSPTTKTLFDFHDLCNRRSYSIIGTHNTSHTRHETFDNPWTLKKDAALFLKYATEGSLQVKNLITDRISFLDSVEMYNRLLVNKSGFMGILIDWSDQ
jgi:2-desacetyl-2-hydroxyethyl bacteriochlorophyllide A dehydrogenase